MILTKRIKAVQEPYLILIIIALEKLLHAHTTLGTRYELQIEDKILSKAVIKIFTNHNKIHCASLCYRENGCVGFGINISSCSLLKKFINVKVCEKEKCDSTPGMKVYMKERKIIVTTTDVTNVSTTTPVVTTSTEKVSSTDISATTAVTEDDLIEISVNLTVTTDNMASTTESGVEESITTTTTEANLILVPDESSSTGTKGYSTTTELTDILIKKSTTTEKSSTVENSKSSASTAKEKSKESSTSTTELASSKTELASSTTELASKSAESSTAVQPTSTSEPVSKTEESSTTKATSAAESSSKTSIEETTSTTTDKQDETTTTISNAFDDFEVDIKCDVSNHVFQGFTSRETMFFGGREYQSTCVTVGLGSSYVNDEEKEFTFSPPEKGKCSGYKYPGIKHIKIKLRDKELKKFTLYCGELKEERVVKDSDISTTNSAPENKKITCKDKQVIIGFKAVRYEEGHYKIEADCRELQNPEESAASSDSAGNTDNTDNAGNTDNTDGAGNSAYSPAQHPYSNL